jgi:hypothetical protein
LFFCSALQGIGTPGAQICLVQLFFRNVEWTGSKYVHACSISVFRRRFDNSSKRLQTRLLLVDPLRETVIVALFEVTIMNVGFTSSPLTRRPTYAAELGLGRSCRAPKKFGKQGTLKRKGTVETVPPASQGAEAETCLRRSTVKFCGFFLPRRTETVTVPGMEGYRREKHA